MLDEDLLLKETCIGGWGAGSGIVRFDATGRMSRWKLETYPYSVASTTSS